MRAIASEHHLGLEFLAFLIPIVWIFAWIAASIIYRCKSGKPLFPRAPDSAVFAEAWRSGRSLKNGLTRIGGARNCLLVYVADGALTIIPVFPFNLMFLPEIYGLEITAPVSEVSVDRVYGWLGERLRVCIGGSEQHKFEIWLRDSQGFQVALQSKRNTVAKSAQAIAPNQSRTSWRLIFFRIFAAVWGVAVLVFMVGELKEDIRFREHGVSVIGRITGHTGVTGEKNDSGIVQYMVGGRPYTITSIRGSGVYRIGDADKVRYMPDDPSRAREDGSLWFDLIFGGLGFCMVLLSLAAGRIARAFNRFMNA